MPVNTWGHLLSNTPTDFTQHCAIEGRQVLDANRLLLSGTHFAYSSGKP